MNDPIDQLLSLTDVTAQRHWLATQRAILDDGLVAALKTRADQLMRADVQACLRVVSLMVEVAQVTGETRHQALALLAEANVRGIYLGEYSRALAGYDAAVALYAGLGDTLNQAIAQIGRLWPLANLGRTTEALSAGGWAAGVLEMHGQWSRLADLLINLGVLHGRLGDDRPALALFDRARQVATATPPPDRGDSRPPQSTLARVDLNRSIVLRNLGEFEAACQASQTARHIYAELGQTLSAAKADESLALTYLLMGRTTDALTLLDTARAVFEREGLTRHAVLVDLFISDCYLLLHRLTDVLEKCQRIVAVFDALGVQFEVGQALVNAAIAHGRLGQPDEALAALALARERFEQENSPVWLAVVNLVSADVYTLRTEYATALSHAQAAGQVFASHGLATREAQARLSAAYALVMLNRADEAERETHLTLALAAETPWLTYPAQALLGRLAKQAGQPTEAVARYHRALDALERLRGAMMVEFRADFVRDKDEPYQALVELYLDADEPDAALTIAERSRSQALVALLSDRLDIRIQAQTPTDEPLVAELEHLRAERNRVYRRRQDPEIGREGERETPGHSGEQAWRDMLELEKKLTQGLHRLLIRNADYARQTALWQVDRGPVTSSILQTLPDDTALVEYYTTGRQVIVFIVTRDGVTARRLALSPAEVERRLRPLWLNLKTTRDQVVAGQPPTLTHHAQALFHRLYTDLFAPLAADIADYPNLIIVPHGPLHYLPFHALHNGAAYLVQRHALSYLPSASVLAYLSSQKSVVSSQKTEGRRQEAGGRGQEAGGRGQGAVGRGQEAGGREQEAVGRGQEAVGRGQEAGGRGQEAVGRWQEADVRPHTSRLTDHASPITPHTSHPLGPSLVIGHSHGGRLPYAVEEARAIGALLGCPVLLEEDATVAGLDAQAQDCQIIHLAAHGEFRSDQPLFSGLRLADGQLTALDTYNLRLSASLVTLSACQTGLNVVSGGDELVGLTRGLLYAGAASLALSHWAVEDRATATLMQTFYHELIAGRSKTEALRRAQVSLLTADNGLYAHPYFWAPFFLVGDPGPL